MTTGFLGRLREMLFSKLLSGDIVLTAAEAITGVA